jgi:antitoxin component YwqK of YwqJK toxin-antitoxin module
LSSKGNYVLGSADSTFEFYDELGRFTTRKFYELGNEEGNEVTFYPSGKKFTEYVYKGDELNGPNRMYAEDGSLMLERMFYDGEIVAYSYEGADGTMITVPFTSGTGEIKTYYKNGKVSAIIGMNNGQRNGKFVLYMPNGEVLEEKNYVDGELEGSYKEFHTNGKLFVEATYKNGKLEGVKKVYQPSGALFSSENYEGGTIHNESTYYGLDGKKAVVVNYYYGHEVKK